MREKLAEWLSLAGWILWVCILFPALMWVFGGWLARYVHWLGSIVKVLAVCTFVINCTMNYFGIKHRPR